MREHGSAARAHASRRRCSVGMNDGPRCDEIVGTDKWGFADDPANLRIPCSGRRRGGVMGPGCWTIGHWLSAVIFLLGFLLVAKARADDGARSWKATCVGGRGSCGVTDVATPKT